MNIIREALAMAPHEGHLGLELEVEGRAPLPVVQNDCWVTHADGSLRGHAAEYVSRQGFNEDQFKFDKIKYLTDKIKDIAVDKSPRTSVHVHVNVQHFTPVEVYTLVCLYWLLENLLVKFCGEETREGNHFCLRATDAEDLVKTVAFDAKFGRLFDFRADRIRGRELRYSAMNLCAIRKFGSVEFRAMRGTVDPHLINFWSSNLVRMCRKGLRTTPSELMDAFFILPKDAFLHSIFEPDFVKQLKEFKHWEDLIDENVGLATELAYVTDWDKYDSVLPQEPKLNPRKNRPIFDLNDLQAVPMPQAAGGPNVIEALMRRRGLVQDMNPADIQDPRFNMPGLRNHLNEWMVMEDAEGNRFIGNDENGHHIYIDEPGEVEE